MNQAIAALRALEPGHGGTHPVARLMGWRCESLDREKGEITVSYEAREDFANPVGMVQGGMLAAMLDDVMSPAATLVLDEGEMVQTLEMKTSYLGPAKIGGTLRARGWVRRRGRDILFLEAEIQTAEGKLVATASATARRVRAGPR